MGGRGIRSLLVFREGGGEEGGGFGVWVWVWVWEPPRGDIIHSLLFFRVFIRPAKYAMAVQRG